MRGDLLEIYKILTDLNRLDAGKTLPLAEDQGHSFSTRDMPLGPRMKRNFLIQGGAASLEFSHLEGNRGSVVGFISKKPVDMYTFGDLMDKGIVLEIGTEIAYQP